MDSKLHFLVVNDSPHVQHVIVSLLKEIGYIKVSEASDGEMAIRAIKSAAAIRNPVNFLITDYAMPHMDGINLMQAIRHMPEMQDIPILIATEDASKEDVLAAYQAGANGYLVAPFKVANFRSKIESLLISKGLKLPDVSLKSFRPFLRNKSED